MMVMRDWVPVRHKTASDATYRSGTPVGILSGGQVTLPPLKFVVDPLFIASVGARLCLFSTIFCPGYCYCGQTKNVLEYKNILKGMINVLSKGRTCRGL